jgi:Tryptophan-rich Synechocystis species C-terminal domain/Bacterial Ig-like domain/Peptidase M10 serralysin C terminal/Bacterial Ig domain/RTX calcium-binding nonapeptide repeat (4 copies)
VPATSSVTPSGISYVDYVDSGMKWATGNLTYSFPTSASFYVGMNGSAYGSGEENVGFKAFNAVQQAATTSILNMYSQVANVTFTQIAETSTQSATLRYAGSSQPSTAWGYYPSSMPEGGDAWFNSTNGWYANPVVGNYGWLTIIHETGHLLGLKHPQDVSGAFGAVPVSADSLEYTVMSYRSYIGASTTSGLTNATWSFPQTLMMYDIASLQYMYGANYNTNNTDTVYKWNPATGQETINGVAQAAPGGNTIFMTTWDGGGNDTYDFSNYTTNLSVSLQPGTWTTVSSTQLANLGAGHTAIGNIANAYLYNNNPASLIENAVGGSGSDVITGNIANNKLTGGAGNDTLDGVSGNDTAVYSGASSSYQVTQNPDGSWKVVDLRTGSPDGTDTLKNIDFLQFTDTTVAIGSVPPPPPTVPAPVISTVTPDTASPTDGITSANILTLAGTALANATVKVYDGATLLGSATAGANGNWTYITTTALTDGTHNFTATATDGSGNTSMASSPKNVIVDTTAPVIPTISLQSVDSGIAGDKITNVKVVSLTGVAEINSTIKIYDGAALLGSAVANAEGVWNLSLNMSDDQAAALAGAGLGDNLGVSGDAAGVTTQAWAFTTAALVDGVHNFSVTSTDAAGNTSAAATLNVTIDTVAPNNPVITGNSIVNSNQVQLSGTAEAGSTVKLLDGSTVLGTVMANGSGAWAYTTGPLTNGTHVVTATATDVAGNTSTASAAKNVNIVDTVAPVAPIFTTFSPDTGKAGDAITKSNVLTLTGLAEGNSAVKVYDGSILLGTTTANANGTWSYTTPALGNGLQVITAIATDAAGNSSQVSSPLGVIIDTMAPIAPVITNYTTANNIASLSGTAEANATVKIYDGPTLVTTISADGSGTWSYTTSPLSGANHVFTATATDVAGNSSLSSQVANSTSGAPVTIESKGATSLVDLGHHFYLNDSSVTGPSLKYLGADVSAGQFGTWAPIAAEKTATGYEVALKMTDADQYTAWSTDAQGNRIVNLFGAVSGSSAAVKELESHLHQDLNGDGTIIIESVNPTSLVQVGNSFYLQDSTGTGPSIKYLGANVTDGQLGTWSPIAAHQTATGYEVAWKMTDADQYTVWSTDAQGNRITNLIGAVSGNSASLQSFETSFLQDLNKDGHIGSSSVINGPLGGGAVTGTAANEVLFGSNGNDTFVFSGTTWGIDTVANFHPATDVIEVSHTAFADVAALLSHSAQVGNDVVISVDAMDSVTLKNVAQANLTASNFHIV